MPPFAGPVTGRRSSSRTDGTACPPVRRTTGSSSPPAPTLSRVRGSISSRGRPARAAVALNGTGGQVIPTFRRERGAARLDRRAVGRLHAAAGGRRRVRAPAFARGERAGRGETGVAPPPDLGRGGRDAHACGEAPAALGRARGRPAPAAGAAGRRGGAVPLPDARAAGAPRRDGRARLGNRRARSDGRSLAYVETSGGATRASGRSSPTERPRPRRLSSRPCADGTCSAVRVPTGFG